MTFWKIALRDAVEKFGWVTIRGRHVLIGDDSNYPTAEAHAKVQDWESKAELESFDPKTGRVEFRRREVAAIFDRAGNLIKEIDGSDINVSFNANESGVLKDGVISHFHPYRKLGGTLGLSASDIVFAATANAAEIRAIEGKNVYVASRPQNGWGDSQVIERQIYNLIKNNGYTERKAVDKVLSDMNSNYRIDLMGR